MLGLVIKIPTDFRFFIISIVLFLLYLVIRYFSIYFALKGEKLSLKEKLYMTLSVSKGIGEAVMAFVIVAMMVDFVDVVYLESISELVFLFIFYTILTSSITVRFSEFFLGKKSDKDRDSGNR
jgi:Kef-type K+ transport system membrane component KefB